MCHCVLHKGSNIKVEMKSASPRQNLYCWALRVIIDIVNCVSTQVLSVSSLQDMQSQARTNYVATWYKRKTWAMIDLQEKSVQKKVYSHVRRVGYTELVATQYNACSICTTNHHFVNVFFNKHRKASDTDGWVCSVEFCIFYHAERKTTLCTNMPLRYEVAFIRRCI